MVEVQRTHEGHGCCDRPLRGTRQVGNEPFPQLNERANLVDHGRVAGAFRDVPRTRQLAVSRMSPRNPLFTLRVIPLT
jgi:hypothetical protein